MADPGFDCTWTMEMSCRRVWVQYHVKINPGSARGFKLNGERTYVSISILNKGIASRFPFERTRLVEEVIELRYLAELREDLEESVSEDGDMSRR